MSDLKNARNIFKKLIVYYFNMRLIHQRDISLYDFKNILPIHLFENPLDEQNDVTLGLKTNNYQLFISSPGYHQSTLIPLVNFDVLNSFCDIHYESTEKKKDIILRPKFGKYPIQLLLYPLQEMNFRCLYNYTYSLPYENLKKVSSEIKINSFKKKVKLSPTFLISLQPLNISISGWLCLSHLKPQVLYKLSWTVGINSIYVGASFLKDKDDDDIYEFATRYNYNDLDLRFWIAQSTNKKNYEIKSSLEYMKSPYNFLITTNFANLSKFKVSSKLSYTNKTLELGFDSSKKFKCFFGTQIKENILARVGMTTNALVSLEDPPLFKACIVFDKSTD